MDLIIFIFVIINVCFAICIIILFFNSFLLHSSSSYYYYLYLLRFEEGLNTKVKLDIYKRFGKSVYRI